MVASLIRLELVVVASLTLALGAREARADDDAGAPPPAPTESAPPPAPTPPPPPPPPPPAPPPEPIQKPPHPAPDAPPIAVKVTPVAYVEAFYAWNFNRPSNGLTNFRGFDNRHDSFTLSNVALGGSAEIGPVSGTLVLQIGHTPSTYYLAEPSSAGAGGAAGADANTWKYLQEAHVDWRAPIGKGLLLQLGLFLSPIGVETLAIKDHWNWSRSNLFFGLPFYHTGLQATYDLGSGLTAFAAVYNGWNSVVDNNEEKSVSAFLGYKRGIVSGHFLYFGGIERPTGSAEGPYWRHLLDAYAQVDVTPRFSLLAHADVGYEPNRFGTALWYAGAIYARVQPVSWLYLVARGDRFYEDVAQNGVGSSSPIFWPVKWVSSATVTVDVRPHDHLSVRLEYRHDQADGDIYFRGDVPRDPITNAAIANAHQQDTLTLGATAWY